MSSYDYDYANRAVLVGSSGNLLKLLDDPLVVKSGGYYYNNMQTDWGLY